MKKRKIWFYVLLVSIMTLSTVCYVALVRNAKTTYANGKFVEQEVIGHEGGYHLLKIGAK